MAENDEPFWESKPLETLSEAEWEALCDGCGRCCLIKLEDEDTGEIANTRLACHLLDLGTCRCTDYPRRSELVSDCLTLSPQACRTLGWLPETCAYRLRAEGKPLKWWHPLRSGRAETVHEAGISVRGWAISETRRGQRSLEDFIIVEPRRTAWTRPYQGKKHRK